MDSTNLTVNSEERIDAESVAVISVAALIAGAFLFLLFRSKKISDLHKEGLPDPPPIIIKSGTLSLQTNSVSPLSFSGPNTYTSTNFGELKGVKVFRRNMITEVMTPYECPDILNEGLMVEITFRTYDGVSWQNSGIATVTVSSDDKLDWILTMGKKLKQKTGKPNKVYNEKWVDDHLDDFHIGKVEVKTTKITPQKTLLSQRATDYDTLDVGFYNELI